MRLEAPLILQPVEVPPAVGALQRNQIGQPKYRGHRMLLWPTELNRGARRALRFPPHHTKYLSHPVLVKRFLGHSDPLVICNETTHTALAMSEPNPSPYPGVPPDGTPMQVPSFCEDRLTYRLDRLGIRRTVFCLVLPNILFVRLYRRPRRRFIVWFCRIGNQTRLSASEMFFHVVVS